MWHVRQWLFWETIAVSHVCCYSVNHSNAHLINAFTAQSVTFIFPKVVQAHTLGEVGTLGLVLLRVSSGTVFPIFIEIGSDLTEKEQKISWHSFFETRCISARFTPFTWQLIERLIDILSPQHAFHWQIKQCHYRRKKRDTFIENRRLELGRLFPISKQVKNRYAHSNNKT